MLLVERRWPKSSLGHLAPHCREEHRMSTTSSTRSLRTRLRTKAGASLAVAGLLVGGGVASLAVASPAQAACASDYTNHSVWSSYAEAHTEDCAYWSNSYAQHGSAAIYSGWYSGWSWARADVGFSTSHNADNFFSL
jgi:hypothetical protein